MRVFIVDDSKVAVERLADLLNEVPGVELVGRANDVPEAIHSILKANPDVIVLDLQMPGGSGLEVLRSIRLSRPSIWVLVCTNYPYPQYREECISAGANYFLDKSADFDKIPGRRPQRLRPQPGENSRPPLRVRVNSPSLFVVLPLLAKFRLPQSSVDRLRGLHRRLAGGFCR